MENPHASFGTMEPDDEHNRRLLAHVHPRDWIQPTPKDRYHLVVIGAGTAGLVTAAAAAGLGAKVALIERHLLGGDCLNAGCVPSKALLSAARGVRTCRRAHRMHAVAGAGEAEADFGAIMERMRRLRADISPHDSAARFRDLGVDVFLGDAQFVARDRVVVDGRSLRFSRAVIATGARAAVPPIDGLDRARILTNENLFTLTRRPGRMAILGGGPIGCEMAQAFALFGTQVVLIQRSSRLLPREEPEAAQVVQSSLVADGVDVRCNAAVLRAQATDDGGMRLVIEAAGATSDERFDQVLVATGRAPNVERMGLDQAGVAYDTRRGVHVDDRLCTTNPRIFAAGDICSSYKFTHAADFMARTVVQNALFWGRAKMSRLIIPSCTYTLPEVARVGLTREQARQEQIDVVSFEQPLSGVDRAILDGETEGSVVVHVRRGSDQMVGATIVASRAGDLIAPVVLAMTRRIGLKNIASVIHPYPTTADAFRKIGDQYNRTRLTPRARWLLQQWLKWTG